MAYYVVRLYTGQGDRPVDEIMTAVGEQIVPKIKEAGGLQRYLAGVTDDGNLISAAVFDSKAAAERGVEASRSVASQLDAVKTLGLAQSFGGEIVRDDAGPAEGQHVLSGRGVIITTSMPAEQVAEMLIENRTEELRNFDGRVRTLFVQLDDGRVLVASGLSTPDALKRWTSLTKEAVANNATTKPIFEGNVEEINMTVRLHAT
jgi:hypothetical protein